MTEWYYAQAGGQLGPVDTETLRGKLESGELPGDTLVWREGMAQWQPANALASELAISLIPPSPADAFNTPAESTDATGFDATPASPYAAPSAVGVATQVAPVLGHDIVLAGFWKRLAASFIDGILMTLMTYALLIVGMLIVGGANFMNPSSVANEFASGALGIGVLLFVYALVFGLQALYYTWMHASPSQATLGKMAVGIKVVRGDGSALSVPRSLGRWAAYFFLSIFTCNLALLVSAIMSGVTERKQGLHDMMVDSLVVDKWAFTAYPQRQRRELGAITWVVIALIGLVVVAYFGLIIVGFAAGMAGAAGS